MANPLRVVSRPDRGQGQSCDPVLGDEPTFRARTPHWLYPHRPGRTACNFQQQRLVRAGLQTENEAADRPGDEVVNAGLWLKLSCINQSWHAQNSL